ncbi:hypothetical protein A5482_010310 [Cyanobacterium sp. IPPAS B-1200]|uniref:hypothetical protein n=1 Tax=Cyanobacterium sp. IPPAS B-1200 TaxID=1562720 RepID=UPI0008527866|nr:hypothetical protein [Cyanobacterium sp. IPPAS B-1200]OEJ79940.1 hypothetical protein A5482_08070 [Cyanobacterium sp. IPPAS B-1200]
MVYTNRPLETDSDRRVNNTRQFGDRINWGAIIAGLVIAISAQLLLSGIGAAMGLTSIAGSDAPRSNAGGVAQAVGIWAIISLFISLFLGGWITARAYGSVNNNTAMLNGAVLWATTLVISSWLLASGVSGTFGLLANNADIIADQAPQSGIIMPGESGYPNDSSGTTIDPNSPSGTQDSMPNLSADQTRDIAGNAAKAGWTFTFGAFLGLAAALIGANVGARNVHTNRRESNEEYQAQS